MRATRPIHIIFRDLITLKYLVKSTNYKVSGKEFSPVSFKIEIPSSELCSKYMFHTIS
jgi:hypothetical protein